jgi:uncharacterized protein YacL
VVGITWQILVYTGGMVPREETKTSKSAPYIFLTSLYAVFVALMVVASAIGNEINYTCATTESEKATVTPYENVLIAYKSIYAFYCAVIGFVFSYYGTSVLRMLWGNKRLRPAFAKYLVATSVATTALFITAIVSLCSTRITMQNTTKLAFAIVMVILPGYAIAYLFSYDSGFTRLILSAANNITKKTTSEGSKNKSTTKNSKSSEITATH